MPFLRRERWLLGAASLGLAIFLLAQLLFGMIASDSVQRVLLAQSVTTASDETVQPLREYRRLRHHLLGSDHALMADLRYSYRERSHFLEVGKRLQGVKVLGWAGLALAVVAAAIALFWQQSAPARYALLIAGLLRGCSIVLACAVLGSGLLIGFFDLGFALLHLPLFGIGNWVLPSDALTFSVVPPEYFFHFTLLYAGLLTLLTLVMWSGARLIAPSYGRHPLRRNLLQSG